MEHLRRVLRGLLACSNAATAGAWAAPSVIIVAVRGWDAQRSAGGGWRRRGRKKKATGQEAMLAWEWAPQRVRVAKALCSLSEVQLGPLFAPHPVEEPLLQLWTRFVSTRCAHPPQEMLCSTRELVCCCGSNLPWRRSAGHLVIASALRPPGDMLVIREFAAYLQSEWSPPDTCRDCRGLDARHPFQYMQFFTKPCYGPVGFRLH